MVSTFYRTLDLGEHLTHLGTTVFDALEYKVEGGTKGGRQRQGPVVEGLPEPESEVGKRGRAGEAALTFSQTRATEKV